MQILVYHASLSNRNFIFEPDELNLILYTYLVNFLMHFILIKNNLDRAIEISRNFHLDIIQKANFDNYYYIISS